MFCTKCGNQIPDNSAFCPKCGSDVKSNIGDEDAVSGKKTQFSGENQQNKKPKKSKPLLIFLCSLLLIAIVASGYFIAQKFNNADQSDYINTTKGTALTDEEAESIYISDITSEEWEIFESSNASICEIISNYSNEDGYIEEKDVQSVVNRVAEYVNDLYETGAVSYYCVSDEDIYFEYTSGLGAYYTPAIEGYMAGGDDLTLEVTSFAPWDDYSNYVKEESATGEQLRLYMSTSRILAQINNIFENDFSVMNVSSHPLMDESATVFGLMNLPEIDILLWQGHGSNNNGYLALVTKSPATDDSLIGASYLAQCSVSDLKACLMYTTEEEESYWAITPNFVTNFISMDSGLVYLNACSSGATDAFANAFISKGAETVFVNTNDIKQEYGNRMLYNIVKYMSGDLDGIFYTAGEALVMSTIAFNEWIINRGGINVGDYYCNDLEDLIALQNGALVEIRGDKEYTLVNVISGEISFEGEYSDEERSEILTNLHVRLTAEDGTYKDFSLDDVGFFINKMDAGTYTICLYEGDVKIDESTVTVESHHRSEVTLVYPPKIELTGYVYDEEGNPLSDVSVSANAESGDSEWNDTTVTDESGYYALGVTDEVLYTLTYEKSGYISAETTFEGTSEQQNSIQVELDDVVLEQSKLMGTVVDAETGEALSGVEVTIAEKDAITQYVTVSRTTDSNGAFSIPIASAGIYKVTFELEGYEGVTVTATMTKGMHTDIGTISMESIYLETLIPEDAMEWNGHYYYIYSGVCDTWEEAVEYCESLGGYIAVISSEAENEALFAYVSESGLQDGGVYFGYTDSALEGTWTWVSDELSSYTNWASNEPNSENSSEDYAEFYYKYTDGSWNDGDFASKKFICEWVPSE
ncbi:MAG: carboxypeptidase regulatory-like domain-containing protein [Clostridia bacterium]|nr:carboxypeptidase regulatory-like domain-containing protein [Clostridia bacterium]